jgi:NAD(P)-dependent dehydrogenase (short-subunit alcohol dehydrogenase family)
VNAQRENIMTTKTAVVTGASSGIGEATAERLAKAGYKVYGTSRRGARAGKRSFEMLTLDVTSDESVASAVGEVIAAERQIDLLVNNAGFGVGPRGSRREHDRPGPIDLRHELFRDGADDSGRGAPYATSWGRPNYQHRLSAWLPADALRGALCGDQTRDRRLFGIARR